MATDIYLDWATGADTNTGTSSGSPKKHFNEPGGGDHGALYLMPNPITDVVTFHIAGSVASAANYRYIDAIDATIEPVRRRVLRHGRADCVSVCGLG